MKTLRLSVIVIALFPFLHTRTLTAQSCTGLCLQQVSCPGNGTTSVSGTVYAPNGTDPLPNVVVYVPNGGPGPSYGVQPMVPGGSNPPTISGSPLVSTTSASDGTFTLTDMPVGANIPLVIQTGKWRRMAMIQNVSTCVNTPLSASLTSLPQTPRQYSGSDNVPKIAVVTGAVDNIECSLRQIGVPDSQFTDPGGTGAINLYLGDLGPGAQIDSNTPTEDSLWGAQPNVNAYDLLLLPNQGSPNDPAANSAAQQELINYANAGGRVFTSHFSYDWLYNDAPFSSTAVWAVDPTDSNQFGADPGTGLINTGDPRGATLAQWLQFIGASTTYGQISVDTLRNDFTGVVTPSFLWLSVNDPLLGTVPQLYSFDTPVGATPANQLGRVFFKDFEGGEYGFSQGTTFPSECIGGPMTPEQKLIEYSFFDLSGFLPSPLQTITFTVNAPASAAYNSSFTVAASASSGLPLQYSSSGSCSNIGATYTMTSGAGSCSVIANQAGNGSYLPAPQVTETTTATLSNTSVGLGSSLNPSDYGQSVTFMATITSNTGQGALSGTVTWSSNTGCAASSISGYPGTATCVTSALAVGSDTVTATYSGDANHNGAAGTIMQNVVSSTAVTITPASLSFGNEAVNGTSAAKSVTLKNTGTTTLYIDSATTSADFAITSSTCAVVAPDKTCKVEITFSPTQVGAQTGTLTITDNAPNSPQTVPLSGTGVADATLTPASATYPAQKVGTESAPKTFTLTNNQTTTLSNIVITTTGDFSQVGTDCGTSLAGKGKCWVSVVFTPTQTGTRTGQLILNDSSNNSPQTSNLTGTGH